MKAEPAVALLVRTAKLFRPVDCAGIRRTYVSDIERGRRNLVEKLAGPVKVTPGQLID